MLIDAYIFVYMRMHVEDLIYATLDGIKQPILAGADRHGWLWWTLDIEMAGAS